MTNIWRRIKQSLRGEEGATIVEYGLIVVLISVVAIAAIIIIGQYVNGAFTGVANEMEAANAPKVP